jgi:2,3-bisphosphoglycerate-dependent phosphoglycerate mutase
MSQPTSDEGAPPSGIRIIFESPPGATRVVLIRHGEAVCNVSGIVGGPIGCEGLTARGVGQAHALAARLKATRELSGVDALYASTLPRAIETARILAPALEATGTGLPVAVHERDDLCEMDPGEGDGLGWDAFVARYGEPNWDLDLEKPLSPGGESRSGFLARAAQAVTAVAEAHPGQLVVVVCHAGVIDAAMQAFLPVIDLTKVHRGWIRIEHASMTIWERADQAWSLLRFNDVTPVDVSFNQQA